MTQNGREPRRKLDTFVPSEQHLVWSYEMFAEFRQVVARVARSDFLWPHEQSHLEEVIDRIDATVNLKHEREKYRAKKESSTPAGKEPP